MNFIYLKITGRLFLVCSFILSVVLFSCKKKANDYVFTIDVNPSQAEQTYLEKSIVNMTIKLESSDQIHSLKISEKRTSAFTKVVLDTTLNATKSTIFWDYQLPEYSKDAPQYYLDLDVIFTNGNTSTKRFIYNITRKEILLQELAGQTFFSRMSTNASGFDIIQMKAVSPGLVSNSTISFKDSSTTDTLSKIWVSPAGGKFVKFTGGSFDYGNATLAKVQDAYASGIKLELVSNISEEDIIIYFQNPDIYKLIKITAIQDLTANKNDQYVFSIKQP